MAEHFIPRAEAERDLQSCAAYLAESIQSNDGRAQAMTAVVPLYLKKGDVDLAAELANSVDDPFVRDRLLISVAEQCVVNDDADYALQLVDAIEDSGLQAHARERVGVRSAEVGRLESARERVGELAHPDYVIGAIAIRQHADSSLDEAIATVQEIEFATAAAQTFITMAAASIERQDFDDATRLLDLANRKTDEIEHIEEQSRTFVDIANSFTAANRRDRAIEIFDKARAIAETIDNSHRDKLLASISIGFLRAGSVELADRTLDIISDKTQIGATLLGFSREFWIRDEKDDALESLDEALAILRSQSGRETRDSRAKFAVLRSVATQFAGFEKGVRGIEIAQSIDDDGESVNALTEIARILTVQKDDETARIAMNSIREDGDRVFALIGAGDVLKSSGENEIALRTFAEAESLTDEVPQLPLRSSALNLLAERYSELGDSNKSNELVRKNLETIAEIRDESNRAIALAELADSAGKFGFFLDPVDADVVSSILKPKS